MSGGGTVYLLHFAEPYHHALHYLGFADGGPEEVEARLAAHFAGTGARLMRAVRAAGIDFQVVRLWRGRDRHFERRRKRRKDTPALCPVCRGAPPWLRGWREGDVEELAEGVS